MLLSLSPMNCILLRVNHDLPTTPEGFSYSIKSYQGWIVRTIAECVVFPRGVLHVQGALKPCNNIRDMIYGGMG